MLNKTYNVVKIYAELAFYYISTTDLNDKNQLYSGHLFF